MKPLTAIISYRSREKLVRHFLGLLAFMLFCFLVMEATALAFQYIMTRYEGEEHTFVDGLYWAATTLTTVGFGDITFNSAEGKLFSGFVSLVGMVLFGILLPFSIIAVVFGPWLHKILRYRPRIRLPRKISKHIIICGWDSVTETLVRKLIYDGMPYTVLTSEESENRRLEEAGIATVHGSFSDVEVLRRIRVEAARMVIANMSDQDNVNLVLTAASICKTPVTAVVAHTERKELLIAAGAANTLALHGVLGNYMAVRSTTRGVAGHVVDSMDKLLFAEISSQGTPFIGKKLKESGIREKTGTSVIGMWERGRFSLPDPDTVITEKMVLLLVGAKASLDALENIVGAGSLDDPVVILGYGTVGAAAAAFLDKRRVPRIVVDRHIPPHLTGQDGYIQGDADNKRVLEQVNIKQASAVIVTTNNDGTNIFLTLSCRHINPNTRIVARANRGEHVRQLYAAGADFVVSHSSVGANILANMIEGRKTIFLTEGINIFWRKTPSSLAGKTLASSQLNSLTNATLVAIQNADDDVLLDFNRDTVFDANSTLILIGDIQSEAMFARHFL